jgi:hypothetical protein
VPVPATQKALKPRTASRRARIWELNSHLHCSIIGTCLTAGELRRLLVRLKIAGIETADEHELHMLGVLLADRPDQGAKLLQKALDRRHEVTLHRFARPRTTPPSPCCGARPLRVATSRVLTGRC